MAEVGLSVVAKLAEYLVDPTLHQLQYLFCVSKITRNVETRKEELILKQGRVQQRVEEAIKKTERIDDEVKKWKSEVGSLIADAENFEHELRANNGCFQRWCPTWRKYCLCKRMAKTTQRMIELNTKSDHFNPFSHPVIVSDIEYHSSKSFVFFNSTKVASDQLWEALQDDRSFIIGLFGMGGSGKTTLVKEVGKKAKGSKLFDRVVFTTITQTPDIRKIQGEIADMLGLKLEEESEMGRAKRIALRLQSPEEKILMILDDVWAKLNLEDIGDPLGENHQRGCKILLTTRRQEVCTLMGCQKKIPLHLLTEDEAWSLFQTHANVDNGAREIVARKIAKECKGLPIAIMALGMCLRGKGLDEMNVVLHKLKHLKPIDVDKGVMDAFACLKLSYDYLRTPEAKLLFLLCAMFPEDHKIVVEDILRYGVGLGLYRDADSFEIARSQVRVTINILIDSSLLMYSQNINKQERLTMHDLVRDVALWIASREDSIIMANHGKELHEFLEFEAIKDCYGVSSWHGIGLHQFPCRMNAPKLEIMLLNSTVPLDLSRASFEGIQRLKVMSISKKFGSSSVMELPLQSIQWLSNLRTLQLQGWDLGDISFVVRLTRLESLDLKGSNFKKIPNGIEKLNKLKLLDLSSCRTDECCYKVIGRCSQLEELYVAMNFLHWGNINCYECLGGITAFPKLRRYILAMPQYKGVSNFWSECRRVLYLGELNISISSAVIKDLAQRAIAITFDKLHGDCKSFFPDIVQIVGGMNELTKLCLHCCSEIECLTNKTTSHNNAVVPNLVELELESMYNLIQLCHGPPLPGLFQNLESLYIKGCPQLNNMFPSGCNLGKLKFLTILSSPMLMSLFPISVACTLLSLRKLRIEKCGELKHVIEEEAGTDAWENLKFPEWRILIVSDCYRLESICPMFCVQGFVKLHYLSIKNASQLKFVFGEPAGEERPINDQFETPILLPLLKYLILKDLQNLLRISSESYHPRWPSLKSLHCKNCPKLSTSCDSLMIGSELQQSHPNMDLHAVDGHPRWNEESKSLVTASNIEGITLENCWVAYIFRYQTVVEVQKPTVSNAFNHTIQFPRFQYLKDLSVHNCAKLKFVFSAGICQSLPELTSVTISNCKELGEIFVENDKTQKNLSMAGTCLPKLQSLSIEQCRKLRIIFSMMFTVASSMLPQLRTLSISNAARLEEIFRFTNIEEHVTNNEKEIMFPNLKDITLEKLPRLVNVCHGFKLHIVEFCRVKVYECPNFLPILSATAQWGTKGLERCHVLKYSQLGNSEAFTVPLWVINSEEFDIQSCRIEDMFRFIGGNDQQEAKDSEILRFEHQIPKGLVPTHILSFQYLHSLEVIQCEKLKFLFSLNTIVHYSLPNLVFLTLSDCEELEEIIADNEEHQNISNAQVWFPKLIKLEVKRCNKLKRLFSSIMASKLPQLNSPCITDTSHVEETLRCTNIEDYVRDSEKEIMFPILKDIILEKLPGLVNVCLGFKLHIEKFCRVQVHECPRFVPIVGVSTHWSQERLVRKFVLKCSQLSNNEALTLPFPVQNSGQLGIQSSEVQEIFHVICYDDRQEANDSEMLGSRHHILQGLIPTPVLNFQYLQTLEVVRCEKLKFLFSMSIIVHNSLPRLTFLTLSECEELEEIIADNEKSQNISSAQVCFPKLRELEVKRCNKLKRLFSTSMATMLPRLKSLYIKECEELEEIISERQEHNSPSASSNSLCFPILAELKVHRCSKLKCLFFSLPSNGDLALLQYLEVVGCTQLEQVFCCDVEIYEEGNKNVLPYLKELILEELPYLTDICAELPFALQFPSLSSFEVKDCPIFSRTTHAALDNFLPTLQGGNPVISCSTLVGITTAAS